MITGEDKISGVSGLIMAVVENGGFSVADQSTRTFHTNGNPTSKDEEYPMRKSDGVAAPQEKEKEDEGFKREMRDLEEMLSKLNPLAQEFVPTNSFGATKRRKPRLNSRTSMAQRYDTIKRTVYVTDIDQQVTEEQLAGLFLNCGQVIDCRICGDPKSVLRFAFIEFTDEEGARNALSLAGTMLGFYPVRVLPSKTAIAPVNPTFLPHSDDELEMCTRTIYCTNIDKRVTQANIKHFFESFCGEVYRLRLLGDLCHSTRIAFVEFVMAESAIAALSCSGAFLGTLPIRVSPSKTPVRPRAPRPTFHRGSALHLF